MKGQQSQVFQYIRTCWSIEPNSRFGGSGLGLLLRPYVHGHIWATPGLDFLSEDFSYFSIWIESKPLYGTLLEVSLITFHTKAFHKGAMV